MLRQKQMCHGGHGDRVSVSEGYGWGGEREAVLLCRLVDEIVSACVSCRVEGALGEGGKWRGEKLPTVPLWSWEGQRWTWEQLTAGLFRLWAELGEVEKHPLPHT